MMYLKKSNRIKLSAVLAWKNILEINVNNGQPFMPGKKCTTIALTDDCTCMYV